MKLPLLISIFLCLFIYNPSPEWNQNIEKTKVIFSAKKFRVKVKGEFSDVKINTNFNFKDLTKSFINLKIRVKSISTGIKSRDKKILSKEIFFEQNHKFIEFSSSKIEKKEDGELYLYGDLKIRGITKKIEIPLEVSENENSITIKSIFKIIRKDFKVGDGTFGMSKSAKIIVEYMGTK